MERRSLGVVAGILAALMVVVATAGLDDLPRNIKAEISSAPTRLEADRLAFDQNRQAVEKAIAADPELFQSEADSLRSRLDQDRARLDQAATALATARQVAQANRRTDAEKVERSLHEFDRIRQDTVRDAASLKSRTDQAIYEKLHPFDKDAATAPVRKAMADWPDKREDLQSRLAAVHDPDSAAALNSLATQLYSSWDKLLLRIDGSRQKIRLVRTENGETRSEERNEPKMPAIGPESVGMVIEHKPVGKYDSESERTVQPPAYAYMAPPGQSNHYGHWTDGVWHWLPAYLILSQMLHMSRTPPPITARDYQGWHERRPSSLPPPVFTRPIPRPEPPPSAMRTPGSRESSSGWWKERPKPSWSDKSYSSSPYKSRGSFGGSKYQSRGTFRSFGRGRR